MFESAEILIIFAVFFVAVLYSSVGHGGASGYLAVMAFAATVSADITRPTALILNVFVASIAFVQFYREKHFDWKIFLPFAATSVPLAFLGGMIDLPTTVYKIILGAVLILAAIRLAVNLETDNEPNAPKIWICLIIGAGLGFLSGLVGVGGGIFLTPVLLLMNWTETKKAAGISALFILVNSISGLAGNYAQVQKLSSGVFVWIIAAIIGGIIGAGLGSKRFNSLTLRRVLAIVLLFAGVKLILV